MATEDRERKLEEIYGAALQSDSGERAEFVRSACGEDDSLRSEIESLLGWEHGAGSFLAKPAMEGLAQSIAATQERLLPGAPLGPYVVVELLGTGGMGEVYAARDTRLGRLVALKILSPMLADDPRLKHRLLQEAKAASALNHRGIVTLHDVGREDGIDYLVMEYVRGTTLDKLIAKDGLDTKRALRYGIEIADAVAAAHAVSIIHRDLKPGNIMVSEQDVVKVLDFGLARFDEPSGGNGNRSTGIATEIGAIAGTAAYMSPEQARGDALDARSDIFSFGVVLYEMLTGVHPFRRADREGTLAAIIEEQPARLRDKRPGISADLERIVLRCLCKDPAQRFQRLADAQAALEKVAKSKLRRKRLGLWFGIAALIVAALAIAMLYPSRVDRSGTEPQWLRLTDFADSAVQPALSPDGRMMAFIRGPDTFIGAGQIYMKRLPTGEAIQITNDSTLKTSPVFSPDGSQIAYSVPPAWDTWVVPSPIAIMC
jgi:serine/threonine protein kinase